MGYPQISAKVPLLGGVKLPPVLAAIPHLFLQSLRLLELLNGVTPICRLGDTMNGCV